MSARSYDALETERDKAIARAERAEAELSTLRSIARAVVDSLPRCEAHHDGGAPPAAFRWKHSVDLCDEHESDESSENLPYAVALRALSSALEGER